MFPIFFRPGQQIKNFDVYRKSASKNEKGKVIYSVDPQKVGTIKGSLSRVNQKEQERWKQTGHPVDHTIVIRGRTFVKAEDILKLNGREFFVHASDNQAEVGIFSVLYCEERLGVLK